MSTFYAPAPFHEMGPFYTGYHLEPWMSKVLYNSTNVCRPNSLPSPDKPGIKKGSTSLCEIKPDEKCCTGNKVHRDNGLMGSKYWKSKFFFRPFQAS